MLVEPDRAALAGGENVYSSIGRAFDELHAGYSVEQLHFLVEHLERSVAITRAEIAALARKDGGGRRR